MVDLRPISEYIKKTYSTKILLMCNKLEVALQREDIIVYSNTDNTYIICYKSYAIGDVTKYSIIGNEYITFIRYNKSYILSRETGEYTEIEGIIDLLEVLTIKEAVYMDNIHNVIITVNTYIKPQGEYIIGLYSLIKSSKEYNRYFSSVDISILKNAQEYSLIVIKHKGVTYRLQILRFTRYRVICRNMDIQDQILALDKNNLTVLELGTAKTVDIKRSNIFNDKIKLDNKKVKISNLINKGVLKLC